MPETTIPPQPSAPKTAAPAQVRSRREEDHGDSPWTEGPHPQPPRTLVRELLNYVVSAAILGLGLALCVLLYLSKEPAKKQSPKQLVPLVGVAAPTAYAGTLDMVVSGTVVPYREIRVAAEVSGNVVEKYPACEAGNFVTKGTPLLKIDTQDYQLQLETRQAELSQAQKMLAETEKELEGAKTNLESAQEDFKLAEAELERNERIREVLSSSEFDQIRRSWINIKNALDNRENTVRLTEARLERMKAAVKLSQSQVDRAQLALDKTTITAPDNGIIVAESVQEGEFVNAGTQLVVFEDTSRSEVICNLTPRDLKWIRDNSPLSDEEAQRIADNDLLSVYYLPQTSVEVYEPENPHRIWKGVLERFDGIGRDSRTRTIPTRITIAEPIVADEEGGRKHALVRGMYVKCRIVVEVSSSDPERQFLWIPAVALRPGNYVWRVNAENQLERVAVDIVDRAESRDDEGNELRQIIIRHTASSLQPSDRIIISPVPQPRDGLVVEINAGKVAAEESGDAAATTGSSEPATEPTS